MRRTTFLFAAVFLMQFGGAFGTTGVPLLAAYRFNAGVWTLALIGISGMLTYTLVCLALGPFAGKANPFVLAISGAVLYALVYFAGIFANAVWQLPFIFLGGGIGAALYWPMTEALIAEGASGHRLNRRIGFFNVCWSLADAAGAALAGGLYDVWDRLPLVALGLSMLGVIAAMLLARRKAVDSVERLPGRFGRELPTGDEARETNSRFRKSAWVGNFVASGVMGVVRTVFPAPARSVFLLSATGVGLALGTFNALRTLTFIALREWPHWHYRPRIFLAFNSLVAFGMAGVVAAAFLPSPLGLPLVFLSFAAAGVGVGMTYYSSIFYAVDTQVVAASTTRLHEAVLGGGGAAAVLAAGAANQLTASLFGASTASAANLAALSPFGLCAAAVATGLAFSAWFLARRPPRGNMLEVGGGE